MLFDLENILRTEESIMPESPKTTTLPEREEMMRRLKSVMDDSDAVENFYPLILKAAGSELVGMGVVMMLQMAIADFTADQTPFMALVLQSSVDAYITALVDDEEVRNDALTKMRTVRAQMAAE